MKHLIVYKDNYLIEASYKLTLMEQRLMLYCISKLNPQKPQQIQTIIVDEFIRQFPDITKKNAYNQIKSAIDNLYERSIKVKDPKITKQFRWIQSAEYQNDNGSAVIEFSNSVMPYLCQLEKQFTNYQLRNISNFKRSYSIRLYELLAQYRTLKIRVISILELRLALQLDDKFKIWNELNRKVIKPSIEEINEKSDLLISYQPLRKGRAIDSIKFSIKEKSKIKSIQNYNLNKREGLKSTDELAPKIQKHLDEMKAQLRG